MRMLLLAAMPLLLVSSLADPQTEMYDGRPGFSFQAILETVTVTAA